jgi:hypothetical protein
MPGGNDPILRALLMLGTLGLLGAALATDTQPSREISWQEFCTQLLESGEVRHNKRHRQTEDKGRESVKHGLIH